MMSSWKHDLIYFAKIRRFLIISKLIFYCILSGLSYIRNDNHTLSDKNVRFRTPIKNINHYVANTYIFGTAIARKLAQDLKTLRTLKTLTHYNNEQRITIWTEKYPTQNARKLNATAY